MAGLVTKFNPMADIMTAYASLGGEFNPTFPIHVIFRQGNSTNLD